MFFLICRKVKVVIPALDHILAQIRLNHTNQAIDGHTPDQDLDLTGKFESVKYNTEICFCSKNIGRHASLHSLCVFMMEVFMMGM